MTPRARLLSLAAGAIAVIAIAVALLGGSGGRAAFAPFSGGAGDPLAYDAGNRTALERAAAAGLAPVLYEKSPGGVVATARRVARWRPLVERVASQQHLDPDMLEALVFLESAGRPDALAGDVQGAAGLTQILAGTATSLLGLRVDVAASTRLTRAIAAGRNVRANERRRRRVDQRFDPAAALAATGRYLAIARRALHRDDLAFESYHMGIGNLQGALRAYGAGDVPYAQLFFDSTPLRHADAWGLMARLGDDSSTYLWRLGAARDAMARWRSDPAALGRHAAEVLAPSPAPQRGVVRLTSRDLAAEGLRISPLHRRVSGGLAALLRYVGLGVRRISNAEPLIAGPTGPATVDVLRRYRSGAQAQGFQFALDRLSALHLISWARGGAVIHVTLLADGAVALGG